MATDYTDALAMKAIQIVFEYLPKSYKGANTAEGKEAREKMHNASCIAGMAFANAFLGVNHSLAHKLGGEFHIPHGRANAILLPHVIEYNATAPTKFAAFPKYKSFVADKKYAEIAKSLGLKARYCRRRCSKFNSSYKKFNERIKYANVCSRMWDK